MPIFFCSIRASAKKWPFSEFRERRAFKFQRVALNHPPGLPQVPLPRVQIPLPEKVVPGRPPHVINICGHSILKSLPLETINSVQTLVREKIQRIRQIPPVVWPIPLQCATSAVDWRAEHTVIKLEYVRGHFYGWHRNAFHPGSATNGTA
jgi:hypothetical protein